MYVHYFLTHLLGIVPNSGGREQSWLLSMDRDRIVAQPHKDDGRLLNLL